MESFYILLGNWTPNCFEIGEQGSQWLAKTICLIASVCKITILCEYLSLFVPQNSLPYC